jgi:hypothetical protein
MALRISENKILYWVVPPIVPQLGSREVVAPRHSNGRTHWTNPPNQEQQYGGNKIEVISMVHDAVVVRSYCSTTLFHFDASDANAICTTGVSESFHRLPRLVMRTNYGEATNTRRVEKNVKIYTHPHKRVIKLRRFITVGHISRNDLDAQNFAEQCNKYPLVFHWVPVSSQMFEMYSVKENWMKKY